ncbi:hypothetical protein B0J13DRAFT_479811 [Dactylonectria estremocensis]|uniref:BZIP transcription factor n=1 Tax=Dactylonectria estremocensis TaxID=1079267 RepID=A0A9P9EGE4_9HYPO|nr:hypothetical protein B0J13DRAFT_479811 [Dactylonectria estremocensis]
MEYLPSEPEAAAAKAPDEVIDSRRQKKRELDRKAQRLARERTKSRIAELEAMVDRLRQSDSNAQIRSLMDQLAQVTKERDKARQVLRSLDNTIHRHLNEPDTSLSQSRNPSKDDVAVSQTSTASSRTVVGLEPCTAQECDGSSMRIPPDAVSLGVWDDPLGCLSGFHGSAPGECDFTQQFSPQSYMENINPLQNGPGSVSDGEIPYGDDVIVPKAMICHCALSQPAQGLQKPPLNKWRAANELLGKSTLLSRVEINAEDRTSEDTPVRAILKGWDSVERDGMMTDSWRKLRGVDEVCFKTCSPVERLAILRMMHLLMTYHGDPTLERHASVPRWFLMRPSQTIAHSYAIDYFVWPGVRERFVFSQHQYCTNLFWDLFRGNFKILWPYGFRDTYMHNSETGQFHLSPLFEERLRDINSWTMSPDFFVQFPELYGDIPSYLGLPLNVSNSGSAVVPYVPAARRLVERMDKDVEAESQGTMPDVMEV